ncbi:MAG: thioredoxin-disulfide reductase [Holosporales bacterium]|nr:thioredoxin-disulfide reductase [Holosporales bacterium]
MTPSSPESSTVLVLGSGPAGCTAALYLARARRAPLVITGPLLGGQLMTTPAVENYPGFFPATESCALMETLRAQAEHFGATFVMDTIVKADFSRRPYLCQGEEASYKATAVIIATGATAHWLGVPGEERLRGAGVSACATCDGAFFRNKRVAVVGGGNTAVEEALFLAHLAAQVFLVHRRETLRAEKIQEERLFSCANVTCLWNKKVVECRGEKRLEAVALQDTQTGLLEVLPLDGLFVAIGHRPETSFLGGQLELNEEGSLLTAPGKMQTSVPGVFAAGDVRALSHKQAIIAAGQGCQAALEVEQFL